MTDNATIKLTGDLDLIAALKEFREYLPKNAVRSALRKAAQQMSQYVALAAPKLTGRLARNITVRTRLTEKTIRARVTVNTKGKTGDPENAFYWRFLEQGFHTRAGEFRKYPFIAPAFDAKNREAAQMVVDAVEKAIERAERRAKRA